MDDRPLSPVYLDNEPIEIEDSKPLVAKIVAAGGKKRDRVRVVRLNSRLDMEGSPLGLDDVIDRTEVTPVYLKSIDSTPAPESAPGKPGPHMPEHPGPQPPLPPPLPDPEPDPSPPGPLPPVDPDPSMSDIERPRGGQSEGQVE
ncbi:MAG TPA: hypothetical protein VM286_09960 [Candidatus Thermoplasmatota archaeon]|nr:hypothetical protein [Candidatus Thermoplasmatota archaeon]